MKSKFFIIWGIIYLLITVFIEYQNLVFFTEYIPKSTENRHFLHLIIRLVSSLVLSGAASMLFFPKKVKSGSFSWKKILNVNTLKKIFSTLFLMLVYIVFVDYIISYPYILFLFMAVAFCCYYDKTPGNIYKILLPALMLVSFILLTKYLSVFVALLFLVICLASFYLAKNKIRYNKYGSLFLFLFCLQMLLAHALYGKVGWDPGVIWNSVSGRITGYNEELSFAHWYFRTYPNNLMILMVQTLFTFVMNLLRVSDLLYGIVVTNILFVDMAVIIMCLICKKIFNKKIAFIAFIISILLVIFSPWIVIPYTDTIGMLFPILIFYLYIISKEKTGSKKLWLYFWIGITAAIGYYLKPTSIMILVAILIYTLYSAIRNKEKMDYLKRILLIGGAFVIITFVLNISVRITYARIDKKPVPVTHFMMMGMNQHYDMYGGYYHSDMLYTTSFETKEEKINANIIVIKQRLKDFGVLGYSDFLLKKFYWILEDGSFFWGREGNFIKYQNNDSVSVKIQTFIDGNYIFSIQIIWMITLLFILLPLFVKNKDENSLIIILRFTLAGLMIFLLLFEARSRYLINHLPVFIILAAYGIFVFYNVFIKKLRKNRLDN